MMEYEISTPVFSGPLELLLELIQKHELDITKVALAQVTDEFLHRIEVLREARQLSVVAEFLAVAARLLLIKSQVLLPASLWAEMTDEEEDAGDALVRQLQAYRHYKKVAVWLRERDELGLHCYQHLAERPAPTRVSLDLGAYTSNSLHQMAAQALFPVLNSPANALQPSRLSIVMQIHLVKQRLMHLARVTYRTLLHREPTRVEAIVTLQAILELIKQQAIFAMQERPFGEIVIEPLIPPEQIPVPASPTIERNSRL